SAVTATWSQSVSSNPSQRGGAERTAVRIELARPSSQSRFTTTAAADWRRAGAISRALAPRTIVTEWPAMAAARAAAWKTIGVPTRRTRSWELPNGDEDTAASTAV